MRRYLVFAAVALQVLVLAFMAGQREYILATGETVYLRTAPIDPRDPFRGDFVRLRYRASDISVAQLEPTPDTLPKGSVVYAMLQHGAGNVAAIQGYSLEEPDEGLYLRGRTRHRWYGSPEQVLQVKYGIETYFVQQGKGLEMEQRRGSRTTMQIPLEMELAVGSGGTAIIKGHRWSLLGIHLEILERETRPDTPPPAPTVRLSLQNASDEPLAVIDLPNHCSLFLEPADPWSSQSWALAHDPCGDTRVQADHLVVLQPEALHSVTLNLASPRWHVRTEAGEAVPIDQLPNNRFRLVYRPPDPTGVSLPAGDPLVWQGEMPSSAFFPGGRVD